MESGEPSPDRSRRSSSSSLKRRGMWRSSGHINLEDLRVENSVFDGCEFCRGIRKSLSCDEICGSPAGSYVERAIGRSKGFAESANEPNWFRLSFLVRRLLRAASLAVLRVFLDTWTVAKRKVRTSILLLWNQLFTFWSNLAIFCSLEAPLGLNPEAALKATLAGRAAILVSSDFFLAQVELCVWDDAVDNDDLDCGPRGKVREFNFAI